MITEFIENLSEFAQQQLLTPATARDQEIQQIIDVLCRGNRCHPILMGRAGVGCSAVVEGLAQQLLTASLPGRLSHLSVRRINIDLRFTCSSSLTEALNHLLESVYDAQEHSMFVVDGLSSLTEVDRDVANEVLNWVKRILAGHEIRVMLVGDTAFYDRYLKSDGYLADHCVPIMIAEPTLKQAGEMVASHIVRLQTEYQIEIPLNLIDEVVRWSQRYWYDKPLPSSALDLLDAAAAALCARQQSTVLQREHVATILSERKGLDQDFLLKSPEEKVNSCKAELSQHICGQRVALQCLEDVVQAVNLSMFSDAAPLATLLFVGPPRVGKHAVAEQLVNVLSGGVSSLLRFDMRDYQYDPDVSALLGPLGELDTDSALIRRLKSDPYAICLFEHVELAHAKFLRVLRKLMEKGITPAYDLSHNIFIMTADVEDAEIMSPTTSIETEMEPGMLHLIMSDLPGARTSGRVSQKMVDSMVQRIELLLSRKFDSAFLRHVTIIPFSDLTDADLSAFIGNQLTELKENLLEEENVHLQYATHLPLELLESLPQKVRAVTDVKQFFEKKVLSTVAQLLSSAKSKGQDVRQINLFMDECGQVLCEPVQALMLGEFREQ